MKHIIKDSFVIVTLMLLFFCLNGFVNYNKVLFDSEKKIFDSHGIKYNYEDQLLLSENSMKQIDFTEKNIEKSNFAFSEKEIQAYDYFCEATFNVIADINPGAHIFWLLNTNYMQVPLNTNFNNFVGKAY